MPSLNLSRRIFICQNYAELSIQTFKAQFLSIIVGSNPTLPKYLWDLLLDQTKMNLNLLQQVTLDPSIYAWEYFNGTHSYNITLLDPPGCKTLIHNNPNTRKSWDFFARDGFNNGPAFHHYCCFHAADKTTKVLLFFDTIELYHSYLTQPYLTTTDRITHTLSILTCTLQ